MLDAFSGECVDMVDMERTMLLRNPGPFTAPSQLEKGQWMIWVTLCSQQISANRRRKEQHQAGSTGKREVKV